MILNLLSLLITLQMETSGEYWKQYQDQLPVCYWRRGLVREETIIENGEWIFFNEVRN